MGMYYQEDYACQDRDLELSGTNPFQLILADDELKSSSSISDLSQFKCSLAHTAEYEFSKKELINKSFNHHAINVVVNLDNEKLVLNKERANGKVVFLQPESNRSKSSNAFVEKIELAFDGFVGMSSIKDEISKQAAYVLMQQIRKKSGFNVSEAPSRHLVFTGNPGTGKTAVARLIAKVYADLGIIKENKLIETDRSGLIAEYLGQTATKTKEVIESALGGVLFIDEAYSLTQHEFNDYGKEAIDTLVKMMEDHRDNLIVIVAGYGNEMNKFVGSNPGLGSRFSKFLHFDNYTAESLWEILLKIASKNSYTISNHHEIKPIIIQEFTEQMKAQGDSFGNARYVRNFFEAATQRHAYRLMTGLNAYDADTIAELVIQDFIEI